MEFRPTYVEPAAADGDRRQIMFCADGNGVGLPVGTHASTLWFEGREYPVTVTVHPDGTHQIRSDPYLG